jgi:hypothetical protein
MSESDATQIWQLIIETELLGDGTWRASVPGRDCSTVGATEQEARDRGVEHAIEIGDDADEVVRGTDRGIIELEDDDPRVGWVWRFTPQTEQFSDGTWRAWFASGGWSVTGSTEEDAKEKANSEWFRRRENPEEVSRRIATMRRHLVEPVPGFQNTPAGVLQSAWDDRHPAAAMRSIIEGLEAPR